MRINLPLSYTLFPEKSPHVAPRHEVFDANGAFFARAASEADALVIIRAVNGCKTLLAVPSAIVPDAVTMRNRFIARNSVTGMYWNGAAFNACANEKRSLGYVTLNAGELAALRATYENVEAFTYTAHGWTSA